MAEHRLAVGRIEEGALEEALSAFLLATQARDRHCQVEHYRRASGADYFFAYLDDYADTYVMLDNDGAFDRRAERRAFELVMVYDRDHGTLGIHALCSLTPHFWPKLSASRGPG